jgi:membrane protein DedA with SNARE-associated domain
MPPVQQPQEPSQSPAGKPATKKARYHFRWELFVILPVAVGFLLWILATIKPAFTFSDIADVLQIEDRQRFMWLACLCTIGIAVVIFVRLTRKPDNK